MKRLALILTLIFAISGSATAQNSGVQSGTASAPNVVSLQVMSTEPSPLQIGRYADVRFKVTNERSEDFKNLTVSFQENYPFSVDPDNKKQWRIASLDSGDSYEYRMQVRVDANALQGEEEMEFKISSRYSSWNYEVPVQVKADDKGLVISDLEFPDEVGSGTAKQMNITLENTANAYFRNVELGLNPGQQTPVVVSGTSSQRFDSIAPGEERTLSYTLNVDESADNGVYSIPVSLEYENEAGADLSRSASTGIVVGGNSQIEVGLNEDGEIDAGSTGPVNFRFVNRGEGTAKFVKVEVQESDNYTIRTGKSVYLGDMSSDDYQTAETTVYTESGTDSITLPVEVTYQENGQEKSFTENVEVNVLTAEERQLYGGSSSSPLIPVVVVLLLGAAGVYYYKRR